MMDFERFSQKKINDLLTAAAVIFLMFWAWRWFGPGSAATRELESAELSRVGLRFSDLAWIGAAVTSAGYLLWRGLTFLFWYKYFKDGPPDETED